MPTVAGGYLTHLWSLSNCNYSCGCSLLSYQEALCCKTFSSLVIELLTLQLATMALDWDGCSWRILQRMLAAWGSNRKRDWNCKNPQEFGLADKSCCGIKDGKLCEFFWRSYFCKGTSKTLWIWDNPRFLPIRHDSHYGLLYYTNPG